MTSISPSRVAAFNVLSRIEKDHSFSSILLPLFEAELSAADRSLCHELVLGTLRRQIYLDRIIDHFSKGKKIDTIVRIAIRVGLYQLIFLDRIPNYSLVNDSVNLVEMAGKRSAKGFVNAILRRATREKVILTFTDEMDRVSVETSHPRWLIEKWTADLDLDQAINIAAANNENPPYAFRSLTGKPIDIALARPSQFVDGCFLMDKIDNDLAASAADNDLYFQDEGSQMVARSIRVPENGSFLDVCAAPGGKTGLIARGSGVNGQKVYAGDIHWRRLIDLRSNCVHQGIMDCQFIQYDAEALLPFSDKSFDTVFVDAPCSGTGTIRHNPEIRYFLKPSDISEVSVKQLNILRNASNLVTNGGSLVYSTCSLETEENEMVCGKFLTENIYFRLARSNVPDRFVTDQGFARTFPHRDQMDGFFIAEFQRS